MGDVVPFLTCFYVVSMTTSDVQTKHYLFEQVLVKAMYDNELQARRVSVKSNHVSHYTSDNNHEDLPVDNEEINWFPDWASFYWVTRGTLILKTDPSFPKNPPETFEPC